MNFVGVPTAHKCWTQKEIDDIKKYSWGIIVQRKIKPRPAQHQSREIVNNGNFRGYKTYSRETH